MDFAIIIYNNDPRHTEGYQVICVVNVDGVSDGGCQCCAFFL